MTRGRYIDFKLVACSGLLLLLLAGPGWTQGAPGDDDESNAAVKFSAEAAATFNKRCTACHTYGKGIKVGPDLKGVNDRRKHDWLLKFIHGSSAVIKSGDPTATTLFAQFKQQRMPDWTDLSDKQITDILDYIAVGGPDIKPADERNAETASAAETQLGRALFHGDKPLKFGAQACATCHSVSSTGMRGGGLGPDLTNVYLRYQDLSLTAFLRHPCFGWEKAPATPYLTAKESFAMKAFLRSMAMSTAPNQNLSSLPEQPSRPNAAAQKTATSGVASEGGKRR